MNNETFALRSDVVVTVLEDGAVLLDMESKYFYSVNSSGWAILQLLESGVTHDQIFASCRGWDAAETDMEAISTFLSAMESDQLITPEETASPPVSEFSGTWVAPMLEKHKEPLQKIMTSAFDPTLPLAE